MQIDDLIIEVRDENLERVGVLLPSDLVGATFVARYNNVGSWEVKIPNGSEMANLLRTPGYGLIVNAPGGVFLSGFTLSATLQQDTNDPQGTWTINGADDSLILAERLAYPTPETADVTAQTQAYDVRSGKAETVIKAYVDANLGDSAPEVRQVPRLEIQADDERGSIVFASARFNNLQEFFFDLASASGIGYRIAQNIDVLEFQVFEPLDRTATVRMDIENNQLSRTDYSYSSPKLTRAIVAGAGEAEDRLFFEGSSADSEAAEGLWLRRIESFIDDRGTEALDGLAQKADESLAEDGKTIVNISVTPTDETNMQYGLDWGLGDKVTIVVDELEAQSVVTEVGISIESDGVRVGATVGNPTALDFESKLIKKSQDQDQRISNIERNTTGYGINTPYQPEGGTDGTQPTFSGPAIEGTYNRFGNMVYFSVQVDFDNITSFGTGQYYVTLPYDSRNEIKFADGCLHEISTGRDYQIRGAVLAGSNVLKLTTTGIVGQRVFDEAFTSTAPFTLTTADYFHIAGTYEINN
jgi:hypothetical protein